MDITEQDAEQCACGCGQDAVVNGQIICDHLGFAQQDRQTGEWWLAECRSDAEADLRCG